MFNNGLSEEDNRHYPFPIPSRESILQLLKDLNKPVDRKKIAQAFNLSLTDEQEALHRRLRAMERDGQLIFTRGKCYALAEKLELVKGEVIGHHEGYGFLKVEGQKKDLYIPAGQMKLVMHGDIVLAQPMTTDRKGRSEIRIVRVLVPANNLIVGRYINEAGIGFVAPDDNRILFDIFIPAPDKALAQGSVVVVKLLQRPKDKAKAIGEVVEVLGSNMNSNMAIEIALRRYQIPYQWNDALLEQSQQYTATVSNDDKQHRIDLRHLPLVTIDGEDARDFDDAVCCQRKPSGGWRLWVAIADVSYYVRPHTSIDEEACLRGTSVYFPTKVIPMLPEILSNGLCSLNPHVDRLCVVCEMTISKNGKLTSYHFYNAVMQSHARLTYTKVHNILQGDAALRQEYAERVEDLQVLHEVYQALNTARIQRGAIGFETEEAKFIFNDNNEIERIERLQRNEAHKLIEECMIVANVAAAKFVESANAPALYRVHDIPTEENLLKLTTVFHELGLSLKIHKGKPTPKEYAEFMKQIEHRPDHEMLQTLMLRSMKQAIYDPENRGHFGLALTSYAHFTSPIRRYPDLLLHRVIKSLLEKAKNPAVNLGGCDYTMKEMLYFGEHCSMAERRADEATREVTDWLKCEYMQHHIGKTFTGIIASVVSFGLFVRLDDLFIDGLVHVSSLENDYYVYDPVRQCLTGESSKQRYRLGDKISVIVTAVHIDERNIDFTVVSSSRSPNKTGKIAKTKLKQATQKNAGQKNTEKKRVQGELPTKAKKKNVNKITQKLSLKKPTDKKRSIKNSQ